ncbi:MAG: DUF805 domain-containing protein [Chloroflexi bacterium]|nr:DUF805 domain-containing protein [Chloroflexota bacterium]MCY3939034.1 DUF805 domain-containing protein [Chloroflexota bacterium]
MSPVEAISSVFRNYVNFSGRAPRSEYWWFTLFAVISQTVLTFVPFLGMIYALALFLPSLAVAVRRLHDTNRTGWWMLLYMVPALGSTTLAIVLVAILGLGGGDLSFADEGEWEMVAIFLGILFVVGAIVTLVTVIVVIVFLILPGTQGPNRFGPDPLQQQATGGFGDYPDPGHPYTPTPPTGSSSVAPHDSGLPESSSEPAPEERQFCSQCGMRLQPEARFCTECGTAV